MGITKAVDFGAVKSKSYQSEDKVKISRSEHLTTLISHIFRANK